MKILLFAHSGNSGGAENALRCLVRKLKLKHDVHVCLPDLNGGEYTYYSSIGVTCYHLPMPLALPNYSSTLLHYARVDFNGIAESLKTHKFDMCISNTIAILHGSIIARKLNIPHIYYAHEYLEDSELLPTSVSREYYLTLIEETSSGIISCSEYVRSQFKSSDVKHQILPPYDFLKDSQPNRVTSNDFVIQVIGTKSIRKNAAFSIAVAKSLLLRGCDVRLDIIGSENSQSEKVNRLSQKRQVNVRNLGHEADPYLINTGRKVITLICSNSEPYGLTAVESLQRGIPTLATDSGGPSEILERKYVFDRGDLDSVVRKIEHLFREYDNECALASGRYCLLKEQSSRTEAWMLEFIENIHQSAAEGRDTLVQIIKKIGSLLDQYVGQKEIAESIAKVYNIGLDDRILLDEIIEEAANPGLAVKKDIVKYDVVPFAMSKQMDRLYSNGLGLAIELASTFDDPARLEMSSFIISRICEIEERLRRKARILALGDGIGIDSMRLAAAGYSVDYMDYDSSKMAEIAGFNFDYLRERDTKFNNIKVVKEINTLYDVVICLEVIEHVESPLDFAKVIASYMEDGAELFISECFNGIENRWPTHLFSNEKYSGYLPLLMIDSFKFLTQNMVPLGKPYVFQKDCSRKDAKHLFDLLDNKIIFSQLLHNRIDIGF